VPNVLVPKCVSPNNKLSRGNSEGLDACVLTSVHPLDDVRIVRRQAVSLAEAGYTVLVIGADEKAEKRSFGRVEQANVSFRTVRGAKGPVQRWFGVTWRVLRAAIDEPAKVYHFHDPELIPAGIVLRCLGHRVIYDVHEDTAAAMMAKQYIPSPLRAVVGTMVRVLEALTAPFWSGVVTTSDAIADVFRRANSETVPVRNYPRLADLPEPDFARMNPPRPVVVSFGGLSMHRVADGIVNAAAHVSAPDVRIVIGGACESEATRAGLEAMPGWGRIEFLGMLDRPGMLSLLQEASVSLVLFSRAPNHMDVRSNRLFESMAAGLPVVVSDFPAWRAIVDEVGCGICVPPEDHLAIARAIDDLVANPEEAREMGVRGRAAFEQRFNWESQSLELQALYGRLIGPPTLPAHRRAASQ
jgi:glycosyltransferase involved in cell wall biosynthesis